MMEQKERGGRPSRKEQLRRLLGKDKPEELFEKQARLVLRGMAEGLAVYGFLILTDKGERSPQHPGKFLPYEAYKAIREKFGGVPISTAAFVSAVKRLGMLGTFEMERTWISRPSGLKTEFFVYRIPPTLSPEELKVLKQQAEAYSELVGSRLDAERKIRNAIRTIGMTEKTE